MDQQFCHYLGVCEEFRVSGSTPTTEAEPVFHPHVSGHTPMSAKLCSNTHQCFISLANFISLDLHKEFALWGSLFSFLDEEIELLKRDAICSIVRGWIERLGLRAQHLGWKAAG